MKKQITYIFFLISFCSYGQFEYRQFELDTLVYFYTLDSDTILGDYLDNDTATGYIKQYRKLIYKRNVERPMPFDNNPNDIKTQIEPMCHGKLCNGSEIDKWTVYHLGETDYCWEQIISVDYSIEYKQDTIIFEKGIGPFGKKITYVNDSSEVYGQTFTGSEYIIEFICTNKTNCSYWLKQTKQIIDSSDFTDLQNKLYLFEIGEYDREINKMIHEK